MTKKKENEPKDQNKRSYLPHGWQEIPLWEVCENPVSGYSPVGADRPAKDDEVGVLKLNCIHENQFSPEKNKAVIDSKIDELKTPVSKNTLIVSRSNTEDLVGAVCYVESDFPNLFLSDLLWRISAKGDRTVDLRWLSYLLSFAPYRAKIISRANGTSETMKKITKPGFLGIRIVFPKINEQKRIANILSTWDTAIDQTRKLIFAKKKRAKAFMQQMLTGKKRLGSVGKLKRDEDKSQKHWKIVKLKELFAPIMRRNAECSKRVLTASGRHGLIAQDDYFNRSVAGQSLQNYYLLRKGEFAYNRSAMNGYKYGAIKRLEKYNKGILSTLYICFSLKDRSCDPAFYKYLFSSNLLDSELRAIVQVGARSHGLLNIALNDFFNIRLPKPPLTEQSSIAEFLTTAEHEIVSIERKLSLLEDQKRGLMQKLLTGEVRVKT